MTTRRSFIRRTIAAVAGLFVARRLPAAPSRQPEPAKQLFTKPGLGNTWQDREGTIPAVAEGDPVVRWDCYGGGTSLFWSGDGKPPRLVGSPDGRNAIGWPESDRG